MNGWHFTSAPEGWRWFCLDNHGNIAKASARSWPTLLECINDAKTYGYVLTVTGDGHVVTKHSCGD
jgi:hypothetical protein